MFRITARLVLDPNAVPSSHSESLSCIRGSPGPEDVGGTSTVRTLSIVLLLGSIFLDGFWNPGQAQEFRAGAIIGTSTTQLVVGQMDGPEWSRRPGFVGGVALGIRISPNWAVQAEVQHADRGARGDTGFELHTRYLETSLYVRRTFLSPESRTRPTIILGATPAWEYRCTAVEPLALPGASQPEVIPLACSQLRTRRTDLGLLMGGGVEVSVGRNSVRFEGRYTRGLFDLAEAYDSFSLHNRMFAAVIAVEVPIGS